MKQPPLGTTMKDPPHFTKIEIEMDQHGLSRHQHNYFTRLKGKENSSSQKQHIKRQYMFLETPMFG